MNHICFAKKEKVQLMRHARDASASFNNSLRRIPQSIMSTVLSNKTSWSLRQLLLLLLIFGPFFCFSSFVVQFFFLNLENFLVPQERRAQNLSASSLREY